MSSDAAALYPPKLVPTSRLADVFDPTRVSYPWQHIVPSMVTHHVHVTSSPSPPIPSIVHAPNISVSSSRAMPAQSSPQRALSPEVSKRIFDFVRTRDAARAAEARKTGMFERLGMAFGMTEASTVTLAWLRQHDVTLKDIVVSCNISVMDLYAAYVVRNVADLQALGFTLPLLTANKLCLNAQQVSMCFHINGAHPLVTSFRVGQLFNASPPFTADELLTLGVTADSLLGDDTSFMDPRVLGYCGLSANDWMSLGLSRERLLAMHVTPAHCRDMGTGWSATDVAELWDLDATWWAQRG